VATKTFNKAKKNKADEFYTLWEDIESEVRAYVNYDPNVFRGKTILCPCDDPYKSNFFRYFVANFNEFGIKKLIATCYDGTSELPTQLSLLPSDSIEPDITRSAWKIEIVDVDDSRLEQLPDVDWLLETGRNSLVKLEQNGDFRSREITEILDEADVVITNPPFSLFREFIAWITTAEKKFLVISNMNAITYKEIFPLIKQDQIWMGLGFGRSFKGFIVPENYPLSGSEARIDEFGNRIVSTNNTIWLTNLEHGRRHEHLPLKTMQENLANSKHLAVRNSESYAQYDNYAAIDVPFTDAIPSDYDGAMGVPISFLHKYCPEQFEIVKFRKGDDNKDLSINGKTPYFRILIRSKKFSNSLDAAPTSF